MNKNKLPIIELDINSRPTKFDLMYGVCADPDCDCNSIIVSLINDDYEINFAIDLKSGNYIDQYYSEKEKNVINAFIKFIKSSKNHSYNIDFFKEYYKKVKNQDKIKKEAIDNFEPGHLISYTDIFGIRNFIELTIKNKDYSIIDQYCAMPDCNCTEVALNFFEKVHRIRITKPDFSFLYDYINKTIREPIGIEEKDVIDIFTDELNKKFKEKHKELKEEIYPYIEEKIKDYKKDYPKRKLGRNEPCHCGSGKKYKKCCLLKDIEKYGKAIKI